MNAELVAAQRQRLLSCQLDGVIRRYVANATRPKFIALLEEGIANDEVATLVRLLKSCSQKSPCNAVVCPVCGRRAQGKEAHKALKRIVARCGADLPEPHITFLTLVGETFDLATGDPVAGVRRLKKAIRRLADRHYSDCAFHGYIEIALDGCVHFHGVAIHFQVSRRMLRHRLSKKNADLAYHTANWDMAKSIFESVESITRYGTKRHAKLPLISDYVLPPKFDVARQLGLLLVARLRLGARNFRGIRLSINMKSDWNWHYDLLLNEVTGEQRPYPILQERILTGRMLAKKRRNKEGYLRFRRKP